MPDTSFPVQKLDTQRRHTKSPWILRWVRTGPEIQGFGIFPSDGRHHSITSANLYEHVALTGEFSPEEIEANGHLLSAAQEMFEVLETIENDGKQVPDWLWQRIQAVICKAKGL